MTRPRRKPPLSGTEFPSDLLTSLASADSDRSRSHLLANQEVLRDPQAVSALCDQALHWARENPALAHKAAVSALWLAKNLSHLPSEALAHRTLANTFAALANPSEAFSEYSAALELFLSLGDHLQAAITRSSALAIVTETLGAAQAFAWANQAREVFQETGDQLRLARLENNLAVLLFRQEDYVSALKHWQAAHSTLQRIGETSDQAATLRNLAVCSISLNQPDQARAYYSQARELCETNNFTFVLHEIDYNIAYLHFLQGDHHRALSLYRAARTRSRELGDKYHEALCSLDETEVYLELNLLQEAHTVARLAASQFRDQEKPYEEAKALFNLAFVCARTGDHRSALHYLESASMTLSGQGNIFWPGQIELLRASLFFADGRFYEARRSASRARSLFQESGLLRRSAIPTLLLAKLDLAQGDTAAAERFCRDALSTLRSFREPDSLFQALFVLGKVLDAQGDTAAAHEAFAQAEDYLLELRERRNVSQTRVSVVDHPLEIYSHLVGLQVGDESVAPLSPEIFRLVSTAKARSFVDLMALSGVHTRPQATMRSQLVDQVSTLRQELSWLYRRLDRSELPDSAPHPSTVESLQAQSRAKETELAQKLSLLRVRSKDSRLDPERVGVVDIESARALLLDSVLVEFYLAHDIVMAIVLSRDHREVVPVAVTSTVQDLQRRLWHYIHRDALRRPSKRSLRPLNQLLADLYGEIFSPLEKFFTGSSLIIAPHGFLFSLPFHALRTSSKYLVEQLPVSYVPSAAALAQVCGRGPLEASQRDILGGPGDRRVGLSPDSWDPTTTIALELSETFTREAATGQQELTALHLVASARLRADNPLFSSLVSGEEEVTFLDMYRSKTFAPILSIEGSGFPTPFAGADREVSALWGALLNAGARCASIPAGFSQPSTQREHARLLYSGLASGSAVNEAHRSASLALLRRGFSISEWAGLFLVGDPHIRVRGLPTTADHG